MRLHLAVYLLFPFSLYCQNLIPNPSFEEIHDTIGRFTDSRLEFEEKIVSWYSPNEASPDLITPDFDERYINPPAARSGDNVIGIQSTPHRFEETYWSETVGITLKHPLLPSRTYHIQYWIRRADCINPKKNKDEWLSSAFGVLFTADSLHLASADVIYQKPHISGDGTQLITNAKWTLVSEYFTPTSEYKYLYLGQFGDLERSEFRSEFMRSYYVIDDVSVTPVMDISEISTSSELPTGSIVPINGVNFISGTAKLSNKKSKKAIDDIVNYLQSHPTIQICINGHTDAVGSEKSNMNLSKKRAKSIAKLIIKKGIDKNRILWRGFGESQHIAGNDEATGRQKNRRVEFEVIKKK